MSRGNIQKHKTFYKVLSNTFLATSAGSFGLGVGALLVSNMALAAVMLSAGLMSLYAHRVWADVVMLDATRVRLHKQNK